MHYIPYNSRNQLHKNLFGALPAGCAVSLRVVLPRELCCSGVRLAVHRDHEAARFFGFTWERMEGMNEEWWRLDWQPDEPGLYWYHFEYDIPYGVGKIFHVGNGLGALLPEGNDWQLTVYDGEEPMPEHFCGGVIYQIFPDRFYASGAPKRNVPPDRTIHENKADIPVWEPNEEGITLNNDYFGGDLKGIEEKLDYLESLGVTCLYLNPIFEAHSNHRYDTANYERIDPLLGTQEDFVSLCQKAKEKGISILLDGVFNHTGADSVYFNKYGRYPTLGAYQSKDSPYYPWYRFRRWNDDYECWWDIKILPDVDESNKSYRDYMLGENGIVRKWLRLGAAGWRLDVADELPDLFLDELRECVKAEDPQALILGEVWEDASNKCAYNRRRRYLLGRQLDSVMNYPFADALMNFMRTGVAEGFTDKILTIIENYPPKALHLLMNHIGTHDTARAITAMVGEPGAGRDRRWQVEQKLSEEKRQLGLQLMKCVSAMQFTLPGIPSIYYGDEAGMEGYRDPFNRLYYPWGRENQELIAWYRTLGRIRKENPCLAQGEFYPVSEALGCVAYVRACPDNALLTIANRNTHPITYYLPPDWYGAEILIGGSGFATDCVEIGACSSVILKR